MFNFEYMNKVDELLHKVDETNKDTIHELAVKIAENIKNDKMIHVFGTGHSHMAGIELFARAGGLANINAMLDPDCLTNFGTQRSCALEKLPGLADIIYDQYKINKGDMMIITSNSGRNAVPVEMAMRAKKEGVYVVALTNLEQSKNSTSRHPSGKRLFECVDCILDNCVPTGDGLMTIGGALTGPGSTIVSAFLLDTIVCEALQILADEGVKPMPIFQSQNVDGFDNDFIYKKYDGRVKHY